MGQTEAESRRPGDQGRPRDHETEGGRREAADGRRQTEGGRRKGADGRRQAGGSRVRIFSCPYGRPAPCPASLTASLTVAAASPPRVPACGACTVRCSPPTRPVFPAVHAGIGLCRKRRPPPPSAAWLPRARQQACAYWSMGGEGEGQTLWGEGEAGAPPSAIRPFPLESTLPWSQGLMPFPSECS